MECIDGFRMVLRAVALRLLTFLNFLTSKNQFIVRTPDTEICGSTVP